MVSVPRIVPSLAQSCHRSLLVPVCSLPRPQLTGTVQCWVWSMTLIHIACIIKDYHTRRVFMELPHLICHGAPYFAIACSSLTRRGLRNWQVRPMGTVLQALPRTALTTMCTRPTSAFCSMRTLPALACVMSSQHPRLSAPAKHARHHHTLTCRTSL